ncbi:hypothetical protein O181_115621 [Austropuccinia psidii MF-1]|uniref:Uncharacterized protein n=1 Tax=Austropuccinia psidii MF-1 TaxID=1389203 RepID=A0A9Q3K958_9BASI|nr:hypothetical protein [Austropuccinia psidii MF-1]
MSPVHLRNLVFQRNKPEDREGLSRTQRPGRGQLGHSGGWQDTEGNHTHSAIHFPIQQEPQNRGLERHGSSSSAPPTPQIFIFNGAWTTRGSAWHPTGQNLEQVSRRFSSKR